MWTPEIKQNFVSFQPTTGSIVSAATSVVRDEFEKIVSGLRENLTLVEVKLNEAEKNLELATKKIEELETYSR